jgi:hypothetical protein
MHVRAYKKPWEQIRVLNHMTRPRVKHLFHQQEEVVAFLRPHIWLLCLTTTVYDKCVRTGYSKRCLEHNFVALPCMTDNFAHDF